MPPDDPSRIMMDMITDPEVRLACAYVPVAARAAFATVWALDATLGDILRAGRDPMVMQLRLTWWHDALIRLDSAPPPAQPLLQSVVGNLLPIGVTGAALAAMVDGWEEIVDPDAPDTAAILRYAEGRGALLFRILAGVIGTDQARTRAAGSGWALIDLAWHSTDKELANQAVALARPILSEAMAYRWPVKARAISMLAKLAQRDVGLLSNGQSRYQGSPLRMMEMAWHHLSGR